MLSGHLITLNYALCFVMLCCAGEVIQLKAEPGATFTIDELKKAVKEHKPAILFLVQVRAFVCDVVLGRGLCFGEAGSWFIPPSL